MKRALLAVLFACGGRSGIVVDDGGPAGANDAASDGASVCRYPPNVATDASFPGCSAGPVAKACTFTPDGTEICHPLCAASNYEMTCNGTAADFPGPDPSLGCMVIPLPAWVQYYCCPCGD